MITGAAIPVFPETQLISLGFSVNKAHSSKETDEKIGQVSPGLFFIGREAQGFDPFEVIKHLKDSKKTAVIPIIFVLTGDENMGLKAIEAGADELIIENCGNAELLLRIKNTLRAKAFTEAREVEELAIQKEVGKRTESFKQAFEKIKTASLDTIFRLSTAAEYKDTDTGEHIERMSHYSTAIARQLKLKEEEIENILYAAPMHDIGKIGIPDRVLQKPGKLDDSEWEIMRTHTVIGAEILKGSKIEFMQVAEEIALAHHEKWDGTGYPNKKKGTEISLGARIVALADVFDALTSERPYKKPMEMEKSCSIILEGRGTHFDPDVVDAFQAIKDEIAASLGWWKFMGSDDEDLFK